MKVLACEKLILALFRTFEVHVYHDARMVELVDTQDLKSCSHYGSAGSTPAPGTFKP